MMIVSDASILINLARIGELDLLWKLYGELIVPEAVWQEVVVNGAGQPGAEDINTADWVKRALVKNRYLVQALRQDLDAGEAEAIALALEVEAELLLMDERLGRESPATGSRRQPLQSPPSWAELVGVGRLGKGWRGFNRFMPEAPWGRATRWPACA